MQRQKDPFNVDPTNNNNGNSTMSVCTHSAQSEKEIEMMELSLLFEYTRRRRRHSNTPKKIECGVWTAKLKWLWNFFENNFWQLVHHEKRNEKRFQQERQQHIYDAAETDGSLLFMLIHVLHHIHTFSIEMRWAHRVNEKIYIKYSGKWAGEIF